MKIGAIVESFGKSFSESLKLAKSIGVEGVQAYSNSSTIFAKMTSAQVKEVKKMVEGEGLKFSALCGDFGCKMYYRPNECRNLIDDEKRILAIAKELGTNVVTTHIGVVPNDVKSSQYESMHNVCKELADFADSIDGHFAVETGPEKAIILKGFLDNLQSKGVGVNLDPANLVMCAGDDPAKAVVTLKDYIVHTHAKDGIQYKQVDTRTLYAPEYFGLEQGDWSVIQEVPLGMGGVKWDEYIPALKSIGYNGFLTIERECGDNPCDDIALAVKFLKKYI